MASEHRLLETAGHVVETVEFRNAEKAWEASLALLKAPWNLKAARVVVAHAQRFRADVVHVHNTWFALSPAVFSALKGAGIPVVATVHNYRFACVNAMFYRDGEICTDCLGKDPWPGVRHACYRGSPGQSLMVAVTIKAHRQRRTWSDDVDTVIALTPFAKEVLVRSGVPDHRIVVKANTLADPGPRQEPPSRSNICLFVGRLSEEKGIEDLLKAWRLISRRDSRLVVVGDGPLRKEVERYAGRGIDFLGRVAHAEAIELMAKARVLVHPSRWFEGLPMVLVEAAANGTPAVVPDHGALPKLVGTGGWVFESGNVASLASVLDGLTDEAVDEAGRGARALFEAEFSESVGLAALEAAYEAARRGRLT